MWKGVKVIRKCDHPKEVCQLGGVMVMGRSKRA